MKLENEGCLVKSVPLLFYISFQDSKSNVTMKLFYETVRKGFNQTV